ncbi:MAG: hypothetical protein LBK68_02300 [Candidatus Margulisbacteria bacterium]|nr:hypothetical protein [Candidatus Margulisiibacteriota bacterium]
MGLYTVGQTSFNLNINTINQDDAWKIGFMQNCTDLTDKTITDIENLIYDFLENTGRTGILENEQKILSFATELHEAVTKAAPDTQPAETIASALTPEQKQNLETFSQALLGKSAKDIGTDDLKNLTAFVRNPSLETLITLPNAKDNQTFVNFIKDLPSEARAVIAGSPNILHNLAVLAGDTATTNALVSFSGRLGASGKAELLRSLDFNNTNNTNLGLELIKTAIESKGAQLLGAEYRQPSTSPARKTEILDFLTKAAETSTVVRLNLQAIRENRSDDYINILNKIIRGEYKSSAEMEADVARLPKDEQDALAADVGILVKEDPERYGQLAIDLTNIFVKLGNLDAAGQLAASIKSAGISLPPNLNTLASAPTDSASRVALGISDPTSSVSINKDTLLVGGVSDPLSSSQIDLAAKLRGEVDSLENLDQKILELAEQGHKEFAEILRSVSEKIRGALQALENIIAENNAGLADNNTQPADIPARFAPEAVLESVKEDIEFLKNLADPNNARGAQILAKNQDYPAQTVRYSASLPADAQKPKQQEFIASIRQTIEQNISFSENIAEASSNAALAAETILPGSFYSGTALRLKKDLAIFLPYLRKEALRIATEKYAASVRAQVRQEISEQEAHTEAVRMLTPFARMVIQGIITLDDYQTNEAARRSNDPLEALRAEQKKTSLSNPDTYLSTALTDLGALYPDLPAEEQDILRDAFTATLQKLPAQDLLKAANQYNSLTSFQQEALLRVLKNRLTDIGTADLKRLATQIPQLANAVEKELAKRGELVPNA